MKSGGSSFRNNFEDDFVITNAQNTSGKAMKTNLKKENQYLSNGNGKHNGSRIIRLKDHSNQTSEEVEIRSKKSKTYLSKLDYNDRIFVTVNSTSRFIKIKDIRCVTAEKDYTYICTIDDKKLLILRPMIEWEERLPEKYFARIHRSTIVNLDYVEKVEKWFNYAYQVYLKNSDEPFQMSRRYAAKLKERFR